MFLKNDAMSLMKHTDSHLYPTIPSALLFLLHVQQQEIGSFKLANDMVKWSKIRYANLWLFYSYNRDNIVTFQV